MRTVPILCWHGDRAATSRPIFFLKRGPSSGPPGVIGGKLVMSCVVSRVRSAACCSLALLFAAVGVVGMSIDAAHAKDEAATAAPSWCVVRSRLQPDCVYANLVTCSVNAIL